METSDVLLLGGGALALLYFWPKSGELGASLGKGLGDFMLGVGKGYTAPFYAAGQQEADKVNAFVSSQTAPQNLLAVNYGTPNARVLQFNPWNIFKPFSVQYVDPVTHQQRWF